MRNISRLLTLSGLTILFVSIVGCGLTPEEILTSNTRVLCETVTAPNSVDFSNDEILAELKRRNSSQCATQEILDSNLADYRKASETERGSGQGDGGGGY